MDRLKKIIAWFRSLFGLDVLNEGDLVPVYRDDYIPRRRQGGKKSGKKRYAPQFNFSVKRTLVGYKED